MTRTIVIVGFLVAFVAGWVVGTHVSTEWSGRAPGVLAPTTQPGARPARGGHPATESYLAQQLGLTAQQQTAMREVWAEVAGHDGRRMGERRRELREQRDEAIAALVRTDDKAAYQAVVDEYQQKLVAMEEQSRQAFATAVRKTKALLNDEQRAKYEQILQQWEERGRDRGPGREQGPGRDHRRGPDKGR